MEETNYSFNKSPKVKNSSQPVSTKRLEKPKTTKKCADSSIRYKMLLYNSILYQKSRDTPLSSGVYVKVTSHQLKSIRVFLLRMAF